MDWMTTYRRQRRQVASRAKGATWSEQRSHRDLWRELVAQAEAAGMLNRLTVALIAEIALWELKARRFEDRLHAENAFDSPSASYLGLFDVLSSMRDRCRELMREFYAICGIHMPARATRPTGPEFDSDGRDEQGGADAAGEGEERMTPGEIDAHLDQMVEDALAGRLPSDPAVLRARARAVRQGGDVAYRAAIECAARRRAAAKIANESTAA